MCEVGLANERVAAGDSDRLRFGLSRRGSGLRQLRGFRGSRIPLRRTSDARPLELVLAEDFFDLLLISDPPEGRPAAGRGLGASEARRSTPDEAREAGEPGQDTPNLRGRQTARDRRLRDSRMKFFWVGGRDASPDLPAHGGRACRLSRPRRGRKVFPRVTTNATASFPACVCGGCSGNIRGRVLAYQQPRRQMTDRVPPPGRP